MPPTRQRTFRPKSQIRNGALLAVSEAAKLINVPLAQDVAKHVKQLIVALKAPKTNDSDAQNLANQVKGLKDVLEIPIQHLEDSGVNAVGPYRDMLEELCEFQTLLSTTYTELQKIQESSYTNKLASQAEIRERILHLKEELSRTIADFTLRLLVIMLASSAQGQILVTRHLNSAAQEHKSLVRKHDILVREHRALVRDARQHRRMSDKRIRGLRHQVNAVLLMRRSDERIAYLVLASGVFFFNP
ncbi:hypothetical protein RhiXN_05640 [Rhizoctonia solani]|uniref:Uncharacterized protein n=1 Tax=Rhizoctonia solani TaxID=456999 RepID=A0A8H8SW49_9AGAM|nr:uncharacterized protein RhiXN_05640 [Rhizoctonia solani]QRW20651.1 hypothetical protein RhiXN_05640 [Rhizoctonia solani]